MRMFFLFEMGGLIENGFFKFLLDKEGLNRAFTVSAFLNQDDISYQL